MKKLSFNSTLNHMRESYDTYEVIVEKVITICGNEFSNLKNFTLEDNRYIARYHELMCIDIDNVAHCLLFVDNESGDGMLVESEGAGYARKSQFIPNARALIENNEQTETETKIHKMIKEITICTCPTAPEEKKNAFPPSRLYQRTLAFQHQRYSGRLEILKRQDL